MGQEIRKIIEYVGQEIEQSNKLTFVLRAEDGDAMQIGREAAEIFTRGKRFSCMDKRER